MNDLKQITVFTPSYNRAYTLPTCYEALKRQTCKNFIWQIVDDGSTDNTKELVDKWIKEGIIEIQYIYQANMGMHGAHNTGHNNLRTELCICCDSDDYLFDNAIEIILKRWNNRPNGDYSGVIGMSYDSNNKPHEKLPDDLEETTSYDLRYRYKLKGDFKLVFRSDLLKKHPYAMIPGEKYQAIGYVYFQIDQDYKMLVVHNGLVCQEYLPDGESAGKIKRYVTAPKGYMVYRNAMMPIMHTFKEKWWQATHYVSSAIFAHDTKFIKESNAKIATISAIPSGVALNIYIRIKYRKKYGRIKR